MSPFPTVAPSDRGSPPTCGNMRTLRRLLPLSASFGCPLSADTLRSPLFSAVQGKGTSLDGSEDFDNPALPSVLTGLIYARSSQTSQVPDSTLYTHAPLYDPGWPDDTTATGCPGCCLPPAWRASASHDYTTFQGSMTQPAYLLLLCFTVILAASRAEFATDLLAGIGRVGISPTG